MISASEAAVQQGERRGPEPTPPKGTNGANSGGSITPLLFEKIDHPLRRRTDWLSGEEGGPEAEEGRLRDELAGAKARLRAQTQALTAQLAEARNEGKLEAQHELEAEFTERMAREREQVLHLCGAFTHARAGYFAAVEGEVVRLALGIAARVLHREVKLDPLLLCAVVRMALEKVEEDSQAVLHVPVKDAEAWRAILAADHHHSVRVVGEDRMSEAECTLETIVGRVELGVCAQLDEIEKGFFDLLQQRPQ